MKAAWIVARRELKALFDQPTGYILLVVFVGINNFLFFRQAYLFNIASLRPMLELLPWLMLFFVPAVTMRALSEDLRSGTMEVVLAQPLSELSYLLGKYVGQVLFVWIALGLTLLIPLSLSIGADLHVGVIFAQYVGAALLAAGMVGVGVWGSSLTPNQITAFIVAVAVMFVLVLVGLDPLLLGLPPALSEAAARLGVLSHFRDIARGVIDLRDVIYFITLAAAFLALAYGALLRPKLSSGGESLKRLRVGVTVIVLGLVVLNLFGRNIGGRLDLTPGGAYTLSSATRDLVRSVDDFVTIKLFMSTELPPEVALLRRDIDDILRDYRSAGNGNLRLVIRDPSDDPEIASEAQSLGIPSVQFNVMGESQFTVRDGYLGLAVQYADRSEVIPFIRQTDDLEYRLSSFIRGMTDTTRVAVGFYVDPSETQLTGASFNELRAQLGQTYDVKPFVLSSDEPLVDSVGVLVLVGSPDSLSAGQAARLDQFFDAGGGALVLASGMALNQQGAMMRPVAWNGALARFGVSVRSDMVYDLVSNEQVALPTQFGMRMLTPYPLWLRGISTQSNVVNQGIETLFMPWTSTVDTTRAIGGSITPLFLTSEAAGTQTGFVTLEPNRQWPQDSLASRVLAVLVNPLAADDAGGETGRIALFAGSQGIADRFLQQNPGNLVATLNAVDWLAQDEALIAIRAKNRAPPILVFESETVAAIVKWLNVLGVPVALILLAALHVMKRRKRSRLVYAPLRAEAT